MQTNGLGNNRRGGRRERTRPLSRSSVITLCLCEPHCSNVNDQFCQRLFEGDTREWKLTDLSWKTCDVVKLSPSALFRRQDCIKHGAVRREQRLVLSEEKSPESEDETVVTNTNFRKTWAVVTWRWFCIMSMVILCFCWCKITQYREVNHSRC